MNRRQGSFLPHVRVRAINADLLTWVESSKSNLISGGGLYIIYQNNGVQSPFDEAKMYRIFTKEGGYCLVVENTQSIAA